jgi:hypothetical protein
MKQLGLLVAESGLRETVSRNPLCTLRIPSGVTGSVRSTQVTVRQSSIFLLVFDLWGVGFNRTATRAQKPAG